MEIEIKATKQETGIAAAEQAARIIRQAASTGEPVNIILATGASQFEMLSHLVKEEIQWSQVNVFHLDEYVGLPETHPASFRRYLRERFAANVSGLASFIPVNGDTGDPENECRRLAELISGRKIALACIGIGENGHLAFNDPPADFETEQPYLVVNLDDACRKQQLGEGWFPTLDHVPRQAISMSIRQILKSENIVCTAPDLRKAQAVKQALQGPVTPYLPASILQQHLACGMFLDQDSASLLEKGRA
jgi:glucosamine-6-phosphate deaminase